jgi:hypothetical protein
VTDKKNDEASVWKERVRRMKEYQTTNSKTWKRNEGLLWGSTGDEDTKENTVSYGWGLVKSLETSIYVQNPESYIEPYDSKNMELAKILTAISNFDVDEMDLKSIGNIGLIDNFTSGYFACIESVETRKRGVKEDDEDYIVVDEQGYEARRIAPKDLLVHQGTTQIDLSDCPYAGAYFYPTVADLLANEDLYDDLPDEDDLINNYPEATPQNRSQGPDQAKGGAPGSIQTKEKDPNFKTIAVLEIWDKVKQEVVYVTDHKRKEIGKRPWPVKLRFGRKSLYPITIMAFHPLPNRFYAKPELDLIATQLVLLNQIDRYIYQDATTKWRKYATIAGLLTKDQEAKLTDTSVENAIITVDKDALAELAGTGRSEMPNLNELVVAIQDPSPKKDLMVVRDMIKQEITDIIGYGPPDRGGLPKTRSAREAVAIKERLEARLAKRSDAVADFYREFGKKHIRFLQQTMELDRYVRIFDSAKDLAEFRKYGRDDIQGEFNFMVYAGTSQPRSTEAKKNMEMQVFQTLMPLAQAGMIALQPVIMRLGEALQWKGIDALLQNPKPEAKAMLLLLAAMGKGKQQPSEMPNVAAALVKKILTPEEMRMAMQEAQGGGSAPQPGARQNAGDPTGAETDTGTM